MITDVFEDFFKTHSNPISNFASIIAQTRDLSELIQSVRKFTKFGVPTVFDKYSPEVHRWNDRMALGDEVSVYRLTIDTDLVIDLMTTCNLIVSDVFEGNTIPLSFRISTITFTYKGNKYSQLSYLGETTVDSSEAYSKVESVIFEMNQLLSSELEKLQ